MTKEEIYTMLKSNTFELTNYKGESCELQFTDLHVIRDNMPIANYEIKLVHNELRIVFDKVINGDLTYLRNILFVDGSIKTVLNFDSLELQQKGKYECFLVAKKTHI